MSASAPASAALPEAAAAAQRLPGAAPAASACENCGTPVTARYCGACGQKLEAPVHSLWHFTQLAAEDLTHADSRLWRTLAALLFKPGFLTREFLGGRRARYLPPLRLYLVLSVAFFVLAGAGHRPAQVLQLTTDDHGVPRSAKVSPLQGKDSPFGAPRAGESVEQRNRRECAMMNYDGPWHERLTPAMQQACLHIRADNGRSLQEAFLHNLPRAMFLFLPLLAAVMMLLYWHPRHYYVEHLLLFVHNHAFAFLIATLAWAAAALLPPAAAAIQTAVSLYVLWYVYRSVRVVYGQGRGRTLAKLAVLSVCYFAFVVLMFVVNFVYSALTLE
jgi:Protein of unknown function (DUF3667)